MVSRGAPHALVCVWPSRYFGFLGDCLLGACFDSDADESVLVDSERHSKHV